MSVEVNLKKNLFGVIRCGYLCNYATDGLEILQPCSYHSLTCMYFILQDPQVDCYQTSRVQTDLNLSRENLVGLAILLGCDYIPKVVKTP